MQRSYENREQAGRVLADLLSGYAGRPDLLVLALPRGGVPVAAEIADALSAPLDVMIVRKLGFPGQEELAMGAIASGGIRVLNPEFADQVPQETLEKIATREEEELRRRERAYRGDRPAPDVTDRTVILVDDGLATGATMRAAVQALRQRRPAGIVVAVPVAPPQTLALFGHEVDRIVCPSTPEAFDGIGRWYEDFHQTTDDEVRALLKQGEERGAS